ncbi:MAG: methionyl-tRNA formyltransferase [Actinobacteria bacterium]|nr:MAG: methionyl-tRNA formyltransferase [Actinomycetota bacterium]
MRIVFMGTPAFSLEALEKLDSLFDIIAIISQPDRPRGRKLKLKPTPTKQYGLEHKIRVMQPEKLDDDFRRELETLNPDIVVVMAFGRILPAWLLDIGRYPPVNLHASLLPKYRGADPIRWPILNGDKKTGVTTMLVREGLDEGEILEQTLININEDDDYSALAKKSSVKGAELLVQTIGKLKDNKIVPVAQNNQEATYAPKLAKDQWIIDWSKSAEEIKNLVRALSKKPGARTSINGKDLKIYKVKLADLNDKPNVILEATNRLVIGCGQGSLEILELQLEGKKVMQAKDFLLGNPLMTGYNVGTDIHPDKDALSLKEHD